MAAESPTKQRLGGIARAKVLTPARRKTIAKQAAATRWEKKPAEKKVKNVHAHNCESCVFWMRGIRQMNGKWTEMDESEALLAFGTCRFKPPTVQLRLDGSPISMQPLTNENDWCGEWVRL